MESVGIDLHKTTISTTISVCVVSGRRDVLARRRSYCAQPEQIVTFFGALGESQVVVEATASYEWLVIPNRWLSKSRTSTPHGHAAKKIRNPLDNKTLIDGRGCTDAAERSEGSPGRARRAR